MANNQTDDQISVNKLALMDVRKKINLLIDGVEEVIISAKKTVHAAEDDGWNDKSYYNFLLKYKEAEQHILEGVKICDEELLPYIKRIEVLFEE